MKISIITVCYNSESTIKDTLESVLDQTYTNYEYLIIDGKSNDKTLDIVRSYESKFKGKLKIISEKDNGLYDAMNKGILLSTGDIIGIINSDDILAHENVFKKVIDNISDCDGVYSNLLMLDNNLKKPYRLIKSKRVTKKMGWHPQHPTLYLKKKLYDKYGNFNLDYKISADLDLMLRLINNNVKLKYVDDYFVFMRSGGKSTNGLKGYYKNFKESKKVLKDNNRKLPLFTNIYRIFEMYFQRLSVLNRKEIFKATHLSLKPKFVEINTVCDGSTGKIMGYTARKAQKDGYQTLCIYGRRKGYKDLKCIKVGGFFSFWWHVILTTIFDTQGHHGSYFKTKKMVKILKMENPDIIHLHNIHGYYLNYPVLFKYLNSEYKGEIRWTFHDCWPFTGHCPYFILANCDKWKTGCYNCPNKSKYPTSLFFDNSKKEYLLKKKYFTSLNKMTIITPSNWLKRFVDQSFMQKYETVVVANEIDKRIFKPIKDDTICDKYNIPKDKKIILGVANVWTKEKGLYDFIRLSKDIPDDYVILLVGVNKKQKQKLKKYKSIVCILRTDNQNDLAKIYSISYIFINPSIEETFSMTTFEALSCGIPVIVYDKTAMIEFVSKKYIIPLNEKITFETIVRIMEGIK